jgi:hypothetical protein
MLMNRRFDRNGEHGQVLVGAIAFIAFFALVAGASFTYMSSIEQQHHQGEISTSQRSLVEGAANYAVADLTRAGLPLCTTGSPSPTGVPPGSATLSSGEVLTYTVKGCDPNGEPGTGGSGQGLGCYLCVLTSTPNQTAFFDNQGVVTIGAPSGTYTGSIVANINGNVVFGGNSGTQVCVQRPAIDGSSCPLDVGVAGPATAPQPLGTGGSMWRSVPQITDPLASTFSPPSLSGTVLPDQTTAGTISPGIYDNIIMSSGTLTLRSGTYVIAQSLQVSGGAVVQSDPAGTGVTLFIGCNSQPKKGPAVPATCPTTSTPATATSAQTTCTVKNATQGSVAISGGGSLKITAPSLGTYKNLAVYADPNNSSSMCVSGNGAQMGSASINGSIYGKSFGLDVEGNGVQGQIGSIVVGAVYISVSGSGNGLKLTASGLSVTGPTCVVYDATVNATGTGATGPPGRVTFQTSGCSGGAGIIKLSYSP